MTKTLKSEDAIVGDDGIVWEPRWRNEADKQAHIRAGLPITRIRGQRNDQDPEY